MTFNSEGRSPTKSVIPSCPHYSTARPDLSSRAARFLFSRHKRRIAWNPLIRPPMVVALANGKAGLADFPRLRGKHIHARDGTRRVSVEHRPADRPPRAQSPLPALKPAKRNLSTARNSRTHHPHQHIAASARNTAPQTDPRAHNPSSRSCNRPNATSRRPAIHEPIIHTNISPRQRGTPPRGTARPAPSHENRRRALESRIIFRRKG